MILFVGEERAGYFAEEVAIRYKQTITYTGFVTDANDLLQKSLETPAEYIIINAGDLVLSPDEIRNAVFRIRQTAGSSTIIVMAAGHSPKSVLVDACRAAGVTYFILSTSLGINKQELERAFNKEPIPEPMLGQEELIQSFPPASTPLMDEKMQSKAGRRSIAVAGSLPRIGTSTQCLQIIRYIQSQGKNACYIEFNNTHFLDALCDYYRDAAQSDDGAISFLNMTLYRNEEIESLHDQAFDYYVYDYGVLSELDQRLRASFLEKQQKIIVCGTNPSELDAMAAVIRTYRHSDVDYIFSFIAEDDQKFVLQQMDDRSDRTHFAPFAPDPFTFQSSSIPIYEKLLHLSPRDQTIGEKPNKKGGLFRWKHKR